MTDHTFQDLIQPLLTDIQAATPDKQVDQAILPLVVMTVQGVTDEAEDYIKRALDLSVAPEKLLEIIYQLSPVVGKFRVTAMLKQLATTFDQLAVTPAESVRDKQPDFGATVQKNLYGSEIRHLLQALPDQAGDFIADALTQHFFNDFYGRSGLSVRERERYELMALIVLNVDFQIRAHATGSLKAGNTESELVWSAIQLLPYVGFPLVINSIQKIHAAAVDLAADN